MRQLPVSSRTWQQALRRSLWMIYEVTTVLIYGSREIGNYSYPVSTKHYTRKEYLSLVFMCSLGSGICSFVFDRNLSFISLYNNLVCLDFRSHKQ